MTTEAVFSICTLLASIGWLALLIVPEKQWATKLAGYVLPILLSLTYCLLILTHWVGSPGGFRTLHDVTLLFTNPWLLLAGWVHYLTFDLFIGAWQVRDGQQHGIPRLLMFPCLLLTFLFGPAGLLLYMLIRSLRSLHSKGVQV
jgi:Domain of unknown function (DUF4281)